MDLLIIRQEFSKVATLGQLFVNGDLFCDTIEGVDFGATNVMSTDELYDKFKVGRSAVPRGEYLLKIEWNRKKNHYLPQICGVPFCVNSVIGWGYTWKDNINGITIGNWKSQWQVMAYGKRYVENLLNKIHVAETFSKQSINLKIVWQEY